MTNLILQRDITVIELGTGYESLDEETLEEIGAVLLTKSATVEPPVMVLDLSQTSYIGSMFIELLVRAWKRLKERGGTMVLCGVQPFCAEVLRTTRLDEIWPLYPSREQAVAAVEEFLDRQRQPVQQGNR